MQRLILFDIDETLLHSDGVGRRAMQAAMTRFFGDEIDAGTLNMSGKTDPQICHEVLSRYGFSRQEIEEKLPELFDFYLSRLEYEILQAKLFELHAGARQLVEAVAAMDACFLGLLTGNIEPGARLKLSRFDLNGYFPFGAFGCDSADRNDLPEIAHKRAEKVFERRFDRQELVIIGDAVNDIRCAQGYGIRCVITATGKTPRHELEALNPDYLFDSLKDTIAVTQAILG